MQSHPMFLLLLSLFSSVFIGCGTEKTDKADKPSAKSSVNATMELDKTDTAIEEFELAPDHDFPYQLDEPVEAFKLPNKLREISGLGIDAAGKYLYAVQDEDGDLFLINSTTGEVEQEGKFHKSGDYEGVEIANGRVFVVKSSGTLYEVINFKTDNQELVKHKFTFNKNSDIEGLGYDPIANRLLISCKGKAGKGEEFEFKKGIFGLDLTTMKLDEAPIYTISVEEVKAFLELNHHILEKVDKLVKLFQPGEEFIFGPSGLAVHPKTGDVYITSSVGKLLVVLQRDGKIKHMIKLKKKIHEQPEGIVFAQDGTLYISNEGKDGKGKIYKFAYQGQ